MRVVFSWCFMFLAPIFIGAFFINTNKKAPLLYSNGAFIFVTKNYFSLIEIRILLLNLLKIIFTYNKI